MDQWCYRRAGRYVIEKWGEVEIPIDGWVLREGGNRGLGWFILICGSTRAVRMGCGGRAAEVDLDWLVRIHSTFGGVSVV